MAKRRIIITVEDGISDVDALDWVSIVMDKGKISKYKETEQYCFSTQFSNGVIVAARDKRNVNTDSFVVWKRK